MENLTTQERFRRGAADAGRYFQFMADFAGFTPADAESIRATRPVIERHLGRIIGEFYEQLLSFPATRKHFLRQDGTIDKDYLELRMQHQANFWRRTASGVFDDDFARFLDYVGRAHTSHGADPRIYIPERYVIGMVGFVQQHFIQAILAELQESNPGLAARAVKAWTALLQVIMQLLSRVYGEGQEAESYQPREDINEEPVLDLAEETAEDVLMPDRPVGYRDICAGTVDEIMPAGRKLVEVDGLSIGIFFLDGAWYALQNSCLHRGGPVCTGTVEGGILTCPWHGYQYNIKSGELLLDCSATLPVYPVEVRDGEVHLRVPIFGREPDINLDGVFGSRVKPETAPAANEFRVADVKPGQVRRLEVDGVAVALYNVGGSFYATADECTHAGASLSEGDLDGAMVVCPWHASCFDVTTGAVLCGPADVPLRPYRVVIDGNAGRVEQAESAAVR